MDPKLESCALYCINEKQTYVKISPTANDSTPCKAGTNYMCISGTCRKVGCDWVIDSDAIEDKCGICKGDGTKCSPVEGKFTETVSQSAYVKIVTIPRGARNVLVSERKPSENMLAVKLEKDKTYCINGDK
ncbi:A disintegrin and metalloproteinase with thrombospondin motifs 6-like [Temnothorax americanus]|uniref:A disintegrin and metalloproteinase with thrombospondin motifs 6-like n=1 Tax=Temnothorax americanus TaxID=1964332 RepID=UPI0040697E6C